MYCFRCFSCFDQFGFPNQKIGALQSRGMTWEAMGLHESVEGHVEESGESVDTKGPQSLVAGFSLHNFRTTFSDGEQFDIV